MLMRSLSLAANTRKSGSETRLPPSFNRSGAKSSSISRNSERPRVCKLEFQRIRRAYAHQFHAGSLRTQTIHAKALKGLLHVLGEVNIESKEINSDFEMLARGE